MKLYPYKQGSASAKALATALGCPVLKQEGKAVRNHHVINWGSSQITRDIPMGDVLNQPESVARASNKLETFKALSLAGMSVPEWTEDPDEAKLWLIGHREFDLVVRHKLNGHSGDGIEIEKSKDWENAVPHDFPIAPLYTKYIKKKEEYRIHVFQGDAFFVQRKARKLDVPKENVNWKVRNLAGGFIFAHKDVEVDDIARREAVAAVAALALDFGAVDIIHGTDGKFYVLEVNTACGLEGETLAKYVQKFEAFK